MNRVLVMCCLGVVAAFVLPTISAVAQAAVPYFMFVIACLLVWRLAFPPTARRR